MTIRRNYRHAIKQQGVARTLWNAVTWPVRLLGAGIAWFGEWLMKAGV